ncbi:hypothetical protein JCM8547_004687 [Rhodosporidiobolus lusitaniae]
MDHFRLPIELIEVMIELAHADKPPRGIISKRFLPFQRGQYRSLGGDFDYDREMVIKPFLDIIPEASRLERLNLTELQPSDPLPFLQVLPTPGGLRELAIQSPRPSLPPPLATFTGLCTLRVSGNCDVFSHDFLAALQALPSLEDLWLGEGLETSFDSLKSLITGPREVQRLSFLILNMFFAERGNTAEEASHGRHFEKSWTHGVWTDCLTREDATELCDIGTRNGVDVFGTVIAALDIEDEWEVELEKWQQMKREGCEDDGDEGGEDRWRVVGGRW